jgi:hypothetical protein
MAKKLEENQSQLGGVMHANNNLALLRYGRENRWLRAVFSSGCEWKVHRLHDWYREVSE